jgi:hypothetical protein
MTKKGKQSAIANLDDSQINQVDEESGKVPFFLIDKDYGVTVNQYGFELVERTDGKRYSKDDKGEVTGCEIYDKWIFCKSASGFEDAILAYSQVTERKLMSKLVKCKDFRKLVEIRLRILKTINNAFKIDGVNKDLLSACNTIESHQELEIRIKEMNKMFDAASIKFDNFMEFIKEKQAIIVKRTEPKKHRTPKEEE